MPSTHRRSFLKTIGGAALVTASAATPQQKIVSIEAIPISLRPGNSQGKLPTFSGPYDPRRWRYTGPFAQLAGAIIVIVKTDQGVTGFGMGAGGAVAREIIHGHLRNLLIGSNALDVELLWDQMYSSGNAYGRRGVFVMALSGVDNALWDILGKATGEPIHRLLGGSTKEKAPSYFTSADPETGLELGFEHFKMPASILGDRREGRERMAKTVDALREVRQQIGPERSLMIDCSSRWDDVPYTKEMARRLEDLNLYFIEEPLQPDDILGYAQLVREIDSTLIASGEHEYTQYGFELLLEHKAVQVVQPDVTWCGGVTALRKIAVMAGERGLAFIPHRGGSIWGLPLVLSTPHAPLAESFGTGDPNANDLMLAMSSRFEDGHYFPSDQPGFGGDLTEGLIRKHAVA